MISLRHGTIAFVAFVLIAVIYTSSKTDIRPTTYISNLSSHTSRTTEAADVAKLCRDHHSTLYKDVERTEAYWKRVGGMTEDDLQLSRYICERDGNCPIMKLYNGVLYIRAPIEKQLSFQSRAHSQLMMLARTDLSYNMNADFIINPNDGVRVFEACFVEMDKHISEATSTSREEAINHFLMPDFSAFDWSESRLPAFAEARLSLAESKGDFENKIPKFLWRGTTKLQQGTQRSDLVEQLAPQTDIADIAITKAKDFKLHLGEDATSNFKTLPEMCDYQYIVYTEGVTYSGRLKYTSLCNSIQIGHQITFVEFWTHLLEPYYVTVEDWDDAVRKYKKLLANPAQAAKLARGPVDALREHLSPTGISCYIQRMLDGYSRSQTWQVMSPEFDVRGINARNETVDYFTWIPLDRFLAKMAWTGTYKLSENWTQPIIEI